MSLIWQIKNLGEICKFERGLTYKKSDEVDSSETAILRANNIKLGTCTLDFSEIKYIKDSVKVPQKKKVIKGSLIICTASGSKSHLGKVAIIDKDINYAFGGFMGQITPMDGVDSKFIFYHLTSQGYKNFISGLSNGMNINNLKFDDLKKFEILFPPLSEQQRIVKILDETFESIDKVKINAEKNLQNSKAVFESYLQSIFSNHGEDWSIKTLNQISENLDSKRIPITKNIRSNGSIPYYGASGIVDYVEKHIFDEDLLLVSEDGANLLARTYPIAFSISGKSWVNNHAHVLKFTDIVSQKFVELYLNSIKLDDYVIGMAQPKLNQTMLNKITIPFPLIAVQKTIVTQLESLSTETKKLASIYKQKIVVLEELKKSILNKAFSGEL